MVNEIFYLINQTKSASDVCFSCRPDDCFNRPFSERGHVLGYNLVDGLLDCKASKRSFRSQSFEYD